MFRLIDNSQTGKADARANGIATTALSLYESESRQASYDARTVARDLARTPSGRLRSRASALAAEAGLERVTMTVGSKRAFDVGDKTAIAPGIAAVRASRRRPSETVAVSELTAAQYGRALAGPGVGVIVRSGTSTLASTLPATARVSLPTARGTVKIGSAGYRVVTQSLRGFGHSRVEVSVLSDLDTTGGSLASDRLLAVALIAGFLLLAFFFSLLASRALHGQLVRFLEAARRLGGGDFSSPIPTTGNDEFALLGQEFNSMSRQLEARLAELDQERSRVRESTRRIGEVFASGLDRDALLELTLRTALDATGSDRGRVSAREEPEEALKETHHVGRLARLGKAIHAAERHALEGDGVGQAESEGVHLATVALGAIVTGGPTHGLVTVCRDARAFTGDDLELLRSLAARATLALSNVNLHFDMQRQAITDDLTGLASHGHFQELLDAEMEAVRRYRYPVGLIMLDIDDFKSFNDRYGHQQGDVVLRCVAEAVLETSRDVDIAARYGGRSWR